MKPYAYDRRDDHGSIQLHQGGEVPRTYPDEKLIPLYSAEQVAELQEQVRRLTEQRDAVVVDNVALKSNLMFWDAEDPESPYEHPDEIAMECEIEFDGTFDVQVAARMPNRKYRVVTMTDDECRTEQVGSNEIQTPATDAAIAALRAEASADAFSHAEDLVRNEIACLKERSPTLKEMACLANTFHVMACQLLESKGVVQS